MIRKSGIRFSEKIMLKQKANEALPQTDELYGSSRLL
jgi:hypothetical protein